MITHRYYWGWQQVDFQQLMARLGRTGQVFVGGALLIFIFSFLPWYSASFTFMGHTSSGHLAAWHAAFGAWFPVLLLIALGVVTVLWALGTIKWSALFLWTIGTATTIVAAIIIILRWITFPSASTGADDFGGSGSAGAGWALYVSLVVTIAMAVFGYLGFVGAGGDIKNIAGALQQRQVGPPPNQGGPGPYGQG
ncbi:MAG: hypothetical protein HOW97_02620 [Catenulispora sp.]|nr:hypothetical protein [Catenulispora sp.]